MRIAREAELRGAQLSACSYREYTMYAAQFLRQDLPEIGNTLAETVAGRLLRVGRCGAGKDLSSLWLMTSFLVSSAEAGGLRD